MAEPAFRRLRILFYVDGLDIGGANQSTITTARALKRKGHEVFYASEDGPLRERLEEAGIPHIALARRQLTWAGFKDSVTDSVLTSAMIFLIMLGANMFGYFLAVTGLPGALADALLGMDVNRYCDFWMRATSSTRSECSQNAQIPPQLSRWRNQGSGSSRVRRSRRYYWRIRVPRYRSWRAWQTVSSAWWR